MRVLSDQRLGGKLVEELPISNCVELEGLPLEAHHDRYCAHGLIGA